MKNKSNSGFSMVEVMIGIAIVGLIAAIIFPNFITPKNMWYIEYSPTTDAERQLVSAEVQKIMEKTPSTLSGHDQDWDDAIHAAQKIACQTYCRPTMWEYTPSMNGAVKTGKWKYADATESRQ